MTFFRIAAAVLALMPAAAIVAQTPSAAPAGMTLEQYQSAGRARMMERDADHDGKISAAEFAAGGGGRQGGGGMPPEMATRMFARLDANADGSLDKAEIDAMLAQRFARMDANHDGAVTAEERDASRGGMREGASPQR